MMAKRVKTLLLLIAAALLVAIAVFGHWAIGKGGRDYEDAQGNWVKIEKEQSFGYVEGHPAFSEFSAFIQPWKDRGNLLITPRLSLDFVCWLNHFNADSIVDGLSFIADESAKGEIFYRFYTDEEIAEDPSKGDTGLLFIPGEKDAPFAFVTSGGAFKSVCLFAEAFPVGRILHEYGYNVFMLKYRVDPYLKGMEVSGPAEALANAEYGRAMQYIFENADRFGVSTANYAVWGFSAGGRLTHLWGLDNEYGYAHYGVPSPAATVLVYSGWYDERFDGQYLTQPPTYLAWLDNDDTIGEENVEGIRRYIAFLDGAGIPQENDVYHAAKHGFGEGRGTDAEGWVENALRFWAEHAEKED